MSDQVTAVIVNYNTPTMTSNCIQSVRKFFANLPIIVVDNGSDLAHCHQMLETCRDFKTWYVRLDRNYEHGPGLTYGVALAETPLVWTLDSDVEILRSSTLVRLMKRMGPETYAVGQLMQIPTDLPYIHPHCMLADRMAFNSLPRGNVSKHGAPLKYHFADARRRGLGLVDAWDIIQECVLHKNHGTTRRPEEQ